MVFLAFFLLVRLGIFASSKSGFELKLEFGVFCFLVQFGGFVVSPKANS